MTKIWACEQPAESNHPPKNIANIAARVAVLPISVRIGSATDIRQLVRISKVLHSSSEAHGVIYRGFWGLGKWNRLGIVWDRRQRADGGHLRQHIARPVAQLPRSAAVACSEWLGTNSRCLRRCLACPKRQKQHPRGKTKPVRPKVTIIRLLI